MGCEKWFKIEFCCGRFKARGSLVKKDIEKEE